jgi:formate C-acetyltransferase
MDEDLRKKVLDKIRMPKLCIDKALIVTQVYRQTEGEPMIIRRAKAFHGLLNRMPVCIEDWQLIVGSPSSEPFSVSPHPEASWRWVLTELDTLTTREGDKYWISEEDKQTLKKVLPWWQGKSIEDVILSMLPSEVNDAYKANLIDSGYVSQGSGNFAPNYEKVLSKGFSGIREEIQEKLGGLDLTNSKNLNKWLYFEAASICCDAVINYAKRYAKLARRKAENETREERRKELLLVAENCERVPEHPARNFFEALQAFWFTHVLIHFEIAGGAGIVAGRLDKLLYPYMKNAKKEDVKKWLENLWINYNQIMLFLPKRTSLIWSGHPISEQPTLAGVDERGEDASNELTDMMLEVEKEVALPQPDIAIMYHNKIHDRVLDKACEVLPLSMKPKFFNHRISVKHMLAKGATEEDTQKGVVSIGCVTTGIEGKIWGNNNMAFVNLGKILELTLNNGTDPLTGKKVGVRSSDPTKFKTFNQLIDSFKKQLRHAVKMAVILSNVVEKVHAELNPQPFASIFVDDCLQKGTPPWRGGARYNIPGIEGVGLATIVDSLCAIKKLVFQEQLVNIDELLKALDSNFEEEWEPIKYRLNQAPKFGNDDDYVDKIATRVATFYCREVRKYKCSRGVPYYPGLYSVSAHVGLGKDVGALPNGRKAREPLSDGMSPSQGACSKGPTAVLKSMTKIDHIMAPSGTLLNMKFNASILKNPLGRKKFIQLVKTFMDLGGYHIQFNMLDAEMLKDAQLHPDKYPDLLVRVAAYVAQFKQLPKELQEDIIARSEIGLE